MALPRHLRMNTGRDQAEARLRGHHQDLPAGTHTCSTVVCVHLYMFYMTFNGFLWSLTSMMISRRLRMNAGRDQAEARLRGHHQDLPAGTHSSMRTLLVHALHVVNCLFLNFFIYLACVNLL
jgi:hypothetical protein